jgi:hypothetical protein
MGDGQGSSPRVELWVIDWLCLRQPAAGTDDANCRPMLSRSPFHGRATAPVAGSDGHGHLLDELNQLPVLSWPPRPTPGLPPLKHSESCPLPADDGLGLEDNQ